jgi:hypothetical protein
MIITFLVASTGASIAYEQVSTESRNVVGMLIVMVVFCGIAIFAFLQMLGTSNLNILLSIPATGFVGVIGRCLIKLSLVYVGILQPEDM